MVSRRNAYTRMTKGQKLRLKRLAKLLLNPDLSFLVYFVFVASFGWAKEEVLFGYILLFPWILVVIIYLNFPFFRLLFGGVRIERQTRMNHVLEHGTIHFLKERYGKKHKIGGSAQKDGFRLHGVGSKHDIEQAFEQLRTHLGEAKDAIVLSRFCGSNIYFFQGFAVVLLTLTFICFAVADLCPLHVQVLLLANVVLYMLLKYRIGRYFQKRLTMSFAFSDARIVSINKTTKKSIFERNPVFHVRTSVE